MARRRRFSLTRRGPMARRVPPAAVTVLSVPQAPPPGRMRRGLSAARASVARVGSRVAGALRQESLTAAMAAPGVQLGMSLAEMVAGLAVGVGNKAVKKTTSKADDIFAGMVIGGILTFTRWKVLPRVARRNPGLALMGLSFCSGGNSTVWNEGLARL